MLDVSAVIVDAGRPEAGEAMSIDCEYKIFDGSSIQGIAGTRPLLDCEVFRRASLHLPATRDRFYMQGPRAISCDGVSSERRILASREARKDQYIQ